MSLEWGTIAEGTPISASADGVVLGTTYIVSAPEGSVFWIDIPGDVPTTPEVEGAQEGQTVVFRVGNTEDSTRLRK